MKIILAVYGLMATVLLILVATGYLGVSTLEKWQPLMAAMTALAAATLAYRAAMAKVEYDQEIRKEDDRRRKHGVMLKLRLAARQLEKFSADLALSARAASPKGGLAYQDFFVELPSEFQEGWDNLEMLSAPVADSLASARDAAMWLEAFADDDASVLSDKGNILESIVMRLEKLSTATRIIAEVIEEELRDLPQISAGVLKDARSG